MTIVNIMPVMAEGLDKSVSIMHSITQGLGCRYFKTNKSKFYFENA